MHIQTFVWIAICCTLAPLVHGIIQYKVRGHSGGPRGQHQHQHPHFPLSNHYTKSKWAMPSPGRNPQRPYTRPMPVPMASYKVPVLTRAPNKTPAPLIFPSAVWKTPTAVYRPPQEQHKPYFVSPPVTQSPYLLNKEAILNVPTIQQVVDKGPIHTIPAPNLSPADKPHIILAEPAHKHIYHTKEPEISPNAISQNAFVTSTLLGAQAAPLVAMQQHRPQYQVTELDESNDHQIQTYIHDRPDQLTQTDYAGIKASSYSNQPVSPGRFATSQLSAQDLYQLLNGIPPQQQLPDSYGMPLIQQPQLQQHFVQQSHHTVPSYQASLNTASDNTHQQYVQQSEPSSSYYYNTNQIPDQTVSQRVKDNFKPQFHTFNYEEPVKNNYAQSRVTADYSVNVASEQTAGHHPLDANDALAQTQYIQQYFATRQQENNVATAHNIENQKTKVESNDDDSEASSQILSQLSAKNEISPSMFYTSLPNREVAETFATLQAAGSNNMHSAKSKQTDGQMRIYVPDNEDEQNYEDMETQASGESTNNDVNQDDTHQGIRIYETTYAKQNAEDKKYDSAEYEDYSSELEESKADETSNNSPHSQLTFGNKLRSKGQDAK